MLKIILICAALLPCPAWTQSPPTPTEVASPSATPLDFREFFAGGEGELKPSAKLLGLAGRRVRLIGFMARMEEPPDGAFYLCPRPVVCDESGGGTGDLPVEAVLVMVPSARGRKVPFVNRAVEVTGILSVGSDGAGSWPLRLQLD